MSNDENKVGDNIEAQNAAWSFSARAAENFDDHARKSIPMYDIGHDVVVKVSDYFVHNGSVCYEIGVSTGALLEKLINHNSQKDATWIGIDEEPDMVRLANKRLPKKTNISVDLADAVTYDYDKCDLVVSYYCLQFISPKHRQVLINRLYEALEWGGAFILFEKVRGPDARFQDMLSTLYSDFKLEQGFSPKEIVHKTRSLKGIMEPFSTKGNIDLLERAGFSDIITVMKYLCFEGFIAIK